MSNIGYERKAGETAEDRLKQTLSHLRSATKEEYEAWLRAYLQNHSLDETIFVDQPFPVGNEETGGFFVATGPLYVQSDCSVKLWVIIPTSVRHVMRRDECSVIFYEDGYWLTEGELPPVFKDMNI